MAPGDFGSKFRLLTQRDVRAIPRRDLINNPRRPAKSKNSFSFGQGEYSVKAATMENQSNMSSMPLAVGVGPHESLASRPTTPLPPALPPRPDKRCLVLVYIHGFKGNETSFRDFPTV